MEERINGISVRFVGHRLRDKKARKLLLAAVEKAEIEGLQAIHYQITNYGGYPKRVGYSVSIVIEAPKLEEQESFGRKYNASYLYVRDYHVERIVKVFGKNFKFAGVVLVWYEGSAPKLEIKFNKELAA